MVKHLIQGRHNETWVEVEPSTSRSCLSEKQRYKPLHHDVDLQTHGHPEILPTPKVIVSPDLVEIYNLMLLQRNYT